MVRPSLPYQGIARRIQTFPNDPNYIEPSYERDIDVSATIQNDSVENNSMEIGGVDIIIPTQFQAKQSLKICISIIEHIWKDCTIVFQGLGSFFEPGEDDILHEIFIYKTDKDFVSWCKDGRTPENQSSMIHLLSKNYKHHPDSVYHFNELTCVVGDKDPELALIIESIRKGLE
jgi:hypothetical protein